VENTQQNKKKGGRRTTNEKIDAKGGGKTKQDIKLQKNKHKNNQEQQGKIGKT